MKPILLILSVCLFTGSLIPNSDFSQINRFVELTRHFQDHLSEAKEQAEEVSFFQFLSLHYINTEEHPEAQHEEEHQKLPLKNLDSSFNTLFFQSKTGLPSHALQAARQQRPELRHMLAIGYPSLVFHPPIS